MDSSGFRPGLPWLPEPPLTRKSRQRHATLDRTPAGPTDGFAIAGAHLDLVAELGLPVDAGQEVLVGTRQRGEVRRPANQRELIRRHPVDTGDDGHQRLRVDFGALIAQADVAAHGNTPDPVLAILQVGAAGLLLCAAVVGEVVGRHKPLVAAISFDGGSTHGLEVPEVNIVEQLVTVAAHGMSKVTLQLCRLPEAVRVVAGLVVATPVVLLDVGVGGAVFNLGQAHTEIQTRTLVQHILALELRLVDLVAHIAVAEGRTPSLAAGWGWRPDHRPSRC